jgi:TolB-like protein/Tfp pilus assembly protein PilF
MIHEIEKHYGRVFSFGGDGVMAEFPSAVEALKCGLRIQADSGRRNAKKPDEERIEFRIGINAGEILIQGERLGGNAINIAARLEGIADPGGIALSDLVYQQVRRVVAAGYTYSGEHHLKNIREPVAVYMILATECLIWAGMPALPRQTVSVELPGGAKEYRPSLAVLPFRTLRKDESDAYFTEGIVDDIIRALAGLKDMTVISRSSTQAFARAPLDLRRVGHELDVRYVVYGSVRRARGILRIAVELSEAQMAAVIWTDRFDGPEDDLFDLQDRIALRVATSIAPHLRERELTRALRKHPESMTAYDLTLRALDLSYKMERQALDEAENLLRDAIRHDPNYARAYTHLAFLQMTRLGQGWTEDRAKVADTAAQAALAAIQRDRNDALALTYYGQVQSFVLKNFRAAQELHERALASEPSCAWAWSLSSLPFAYQGDTDTAIARAEQAVRLSPLGPDAYWHEHFLSLALYAGGRFEEAVAWGRLSAAHAPSNSSNLRTLAASLVAIGELDDARNVAAQLMQLAPNFNLSAFRRQTHFSGEAALHHIERLRQAGLPEEPR